MKPFFGFTLLFSVVVFFKGWAQPNICGYVYNALDSTAIEGATVYLYDEYNMPFDELYRTQTDTAGFYELKAVESRKYSINLIYYFEFREVEYAYLFQPGIFDVDTAASAFTTPCYHVNFAVIDQLTEENFERQKKTIMVGQMKRLEQTKPVVDSILVVEITNFYKDPIQTLSIHFRTQISTVDSLFNQMNSGYVRRRE
jgi:hypothetical protein